MKKRVFTIVVFALAVLLAGGCAKRKTAGQGVGDSQAQQLMEEGITDQATRKPGAQPGISAQPLTEEQALRKRQTELERFLSEVIYFDFDSSLLREDSQILLRAKAAWLEAHPEVNNLTIEGHCDERGTGAYNMALGERRADEVKSFLVDLGLSPNRFKIISYGEERPASTGDTEEAWTKNRRAVFRLTK